MRCGLGVDRGFETAGGGAARGLMQGEMPRCPCNAVRVVSGACARSVMESVGFLRCRFINRVAEAVTVRGCRNDVDLLPAPVSLPAGHVRGIGFKGIVGRKNGIGIQGRAALRSAVRSRWNGAFRHRFVVE